MESEPATQLFKFIFVDAQMLGPQLSQFPPGTARRTAIEQLIHVQVQRALPNMPLEYVLRRDAVIGHQNQL
ncbi:hypothetical protein D3C75_970780 [compost metagenome]